MCCETQQLCVEVKPVVAATPGVHEYNTDQGNGTHRLCKSLLAEHGEHVIPADLMGKAWHVSAGALFRLMTERREEALRTAESLAQHARKQGLSAAEAIFSILDKKNIRRGTAKSAQGRKQCLEVIEASLAEPGVFTLAVLCFPFRDWHPLKNVGQTPDAGELESLIRLWTIGRAISLCGIACKVVAMRDGTRYPSSWHYPLEQKQAYGDALREVVHALALDDVLELRDVDEKTEFETLEAWQARRQGHEEVYGREMEAFMGELASHRETLLSATSEAEFADRMMALPSGNVLLPLLYPMLHWLPSCALPSSGSYGAVERGQVLGRLVHVFRPEASPAQEAARHELLWQALRCAAQYVSSYRSRSAANNALGLDDVAGAVPNSLRMSIHNKSKDNGTQFPVMLAATVHRTPWHGSAELRFSHQKKKKRAVIDVRLAAEMWHSHVPVVPSVGAASGRLDVTPEEGAREASWLRYCARLERAQQPFLFADGSTLPEGWRSEAALVSLMTRGAAAAPEWRKKGLCRELAEAAAKVGGA